MTGLLCEAARMRADRLVATLLLLQSRGRLTAAEIADELEISERTARRDLDALAMAGIPLYSQQGRGGGWELLGGARTDLSGLTGPEAKALFMVAGPSSSATPEVKSALRKLVRALPEPFRDDAEAASAAVVVDAASWGRTVDQPPPYLDVLRAAVVAGEQVRLRYAGRHRPTSDRVVHPLGLVTKGSTWYLIADTDAGLRTFRLSRVQSVEPTGDPVVRPAGFDLATEWERIAAEVDARRTPAEVRAWVATEALGLMRGMFANRLTVVPAGELRASEAAFREEEWVVIVLRGASTWALAAEIAGFGNRIEVIEPTEICVRLAEIGAQLTERYGPHCRVPGV